MVHALYETLLEEVGGILGVSLYPDSNNSCLVKLESGLEVQLEMDRTGNNFIVGVDLGPVPPGQYREQLFKEALRSNGFPPPRLGVFAFSETNGHVVLFESLPAQQLNGEQVAFTLAPLAEKALKWQEAISTGEVPLVESQPTSGGSIGMFGMRP